MIKLSSCYVLGLIAFLACIIVLLTKMTWAMAGNFFLFAVIGQMAVDQSTNRKEIEEKIGQTLMGAAVVLVVLCSGHVVSWWALLHYGLPAVCGLTLPPSFMETFKSACGTASSEC